jgi:hypothetical protein
MMSCDAHRWLALGLAVVVIAESLALLWSTGALAFCRRMLGTMQMPHRPPGSPPETRAERWWWW